MRPPIQEPRRGRRTTPWTGLALALLTIAALVSGASAEPRGDLRAALDRTDQAIASAEALLVASPNQPALEYLDQARQFQARARSAAAAGFGPDAFRLTNGARRRAFAAIQLAQPAGSAAFLQSALQRTDALLDRIGPFLGDCPNPDADRLFRAALDLQRQATDALAGGRPRMALGMTTDARAGATRALRLAEASCGEAPDRAPRAVQRTDQLLDDASWLSDAGNKAARGYAAAVEEQRRARQELAQSRFDEAISSTLAARDQLVRALARSDRPLARDAVAQAVRASGARLDQARQAAGADGARRDAFARASERQRRAQDLLERGQLAACLAEVHAVRAILESAGL
jgi:hypothetical protein